MRKLFLLCALAPCLAMLVGCPKKKTDEADAAADAEVAPVVEVDAAPAAPVAKNAADVARFPAAEKPVTDDDSKLVDFSAQVRTGPNQGAIVATLRAGVDPQKLAEHQNAFLIVFPDPKDPTTSLMGWIDKGAFVKDAVIVDAGKKDAAVVADAAAVSPGSVLANLTKCPAGQESIVNIAPTPVCRKKCTADKECKTPSAGACHTANTAGGKVVKVCAAEAP